jgi:GH25 family lysozyme M1 (1,4-beta-N-acetylmuramidase)
MSIHLPCPPDDYQLILDLSEYNGPLVDVDALLAAGVAALSLRASDGEHDVDKEYARSAALCVAHKVPVSPYAVVENYGRARAAGQARHFVDVVRDTGWTVVPAGDWELPVHPEELSQAQALECIGSARIWVETVAELLGVRPLVYCGMGFVDELARRAGAGAAPDLAALGREELWVADYGDGVHQLLPGEHSPRIPAPWKGRPVRFWQAGPALTALPWAPHGKVDIDYFHGTRAELLAVGRGGDVRQR